MEAKKLCDVLIVAVNSDASIKRYKGENRPIQDEKTRAILLASLEFIDYVIVFEEDSPLHIVEKLKPDIVAKEGYTLDKWPEGRLAISYGGKAITLKRLEGYSTSNLVEKMKG
jgi:D-beta-D-heptose 7-phosphate kinase/D-beta-D-heptose 1-phosphate adenosyltransferase